MSGDALELAVIRGDGIGPELVDSALEVLAAVCAAESLTLHVLEEPGGAAHFRATGEPLSPGALERLRRADGILKGPVGLPEVRHPDGTEAGLLGGVMRIGLDTFANVRPIRLLPGVTGATRHEPGQIGYVIVRENTEGLYLSRGAGVATHHAACDQLLVTRAGTERVVRHAFELAVGRSGAPSDGVRRVTCVDKSNVLRSFALFREVFDEVAGEYAEVAAEHLYADAAAHELVARPERFDVLVMENFLGDILSDLGAATAGGLGMCPSGNIGASAAYFEPIHGSAPSLAGRDLANPVSQLLSAGMLLRHARRPAAADRLERAVEATFADGAVRLRSDGTPEQGTRAVTRAVLARI
ncbi:MAG: isocitrate/isopropylmalate dehydrogenase family protein [Nocardioidaceae bacterium]